MLQDIPAVNGGAVDRDVCIMTWTGPSGLAAVQVAWTGAVYVEW